MHNWIDEVITIAARSYINIRERSRGSRHRTAFTGPLSSSFPMLRKKIDTFDDRYKFIDSNANSSIKDSGRPLHRVCEQARFLANEPPCVAYGNFHLNFFISRLAHWPTSRDRFFFFPDCVQLTFAQPSE